MVDGNGSGVFVMLTDNFLSGSIGSPNVKEILYEPVPFSHKADLCSKVVCERIKKRGVLLMVDQVHPGFARSEYVIRATIAFWN